MKLLAILILAVSFGCTIRPVILINLPGGQVNVEKVDQLIDNALKQKVTPQEWEQRQKELDRIFKELEKKSGTVQ